MLTHLPSNQILSTYLKVSTPHNSSNRWAKSQSIIANGSIHLSTRSHARLNVGYCPVSTRALCRSGESNRNICLSVRILCGDTHSATPKGTQPTEMAE